MNESLFFHCVTMYKQQCVFNNYYCIDVHVEICGGFIKDKTLFCEYEVLYFNFTDCVILLFYSVCFSCDVI